MAISGVILAGFVVGHLLGNLQIFLGPDRFNDYALTLRRMPALVWSVRILLLIAVTLHIWSSIQLAAIKRTARPRGYVRVSHSVASYAARTMYWSGPIVAGFVVYHLLQFTFGRGGTPYDPLDAYGNVMAGFRVPAVSVFYILSMALLCVHLRHGLWSMFQTLGFYHPSYTPRVKFLATLAALLIFFGFVSIPAAVMAGVIPNVL
jgi:succinate dehydrogenase / fumarate reductase, cytochrome b subunit